MTNRAVFLVAGYLCWAMYVHWMPVIYPFNVRVFFTELILDPLRFFLAMISFFIGFLCHAVTVRNVIAQFRSVKNKNQPFKVTMMIDYFVFLVYYFMIQSNVVLSLIFIAFSIFYGIISVENEDTELPKERHH